MGRPVQTTDVPGLNSVPLAPIVQGMPLLPAPCEVPPAPAAHADCFTSALFTVEMVPEPLWGLTWQKSMSAGEWSQLRSETFSAAGRRCEACGGAGPLECHEKWAYNDETLRQSLLKFKALCSDCHAAKTPGRLGWLEETGQIKRGAREAAVARIARLNGWSVTTAEAYVEYCTVVANVRSRYAWTPAVRPRGPGRAGVAPQGADETPCLSCFSLVPGPDLVDGFGSCCR